MSSVDTHTDVWWLELRKEDTGKWVQWLRGSYEEVVSDLFGWRSGLIAQYGYDRARVTSPEKTS